MIKYQVLLVKLPLKNYGIFQMKRLNVYAKSKELENNPRPAGCKKLVGEKEDLWRVRVGDYRIIYTINVSIFIVDIRRIGHRRDIYNK